MKSTPLKIGVSGVRGIVGETFTPHLAVQLTSAFATYVGEGEVYVCEDARPSGKMVRSAVISALIASGCSPVDLGVCPVPSLQHAVSNSKAVGGVAISAGHNPEDWNALRFFGENGMYFNDLQGEEVLDIYHQGEFVKAAWDALKPLKKQSNYYQNHLKTILATINEKRIRKAGFRVAVDTCNGACSIPSRELLDFLDCRVVALNNDPGDSFPHDPEPNIANMRQLSAVVSATGFDAGFMFDTAGERLALVTESGNALSEESTLSIAAELKLQRRPGVIVTNICSSRVLDDIASKYHGKVVRTPVGQAFVSETALKYGAAIAGEGSGGVIIPEVHWAFDALATMAFILDAMAGNRTTLEQIESGLPRYVLIKKSFQFDYTAIYKIIRRTRQIAKESSRGARLDLSDGIKMDWDASWLHIRLSNTEPIIRVIAEARTARRAEELIALGKEIVSK